jgi:hypothetical protein
MKVIDLIQNMQATIDELSFHPADTDVTVRAGMHRLDGTMAVTDKEGKVSLNMHATTLFDVGDFETFKERCEAMRQDALSAKGKGNTLGNPVRDPVINHALLPDDDDELQGVPQINGMKALTDAHIKDHRRVWEGYRGPVANKFYREEQRALNAKDDDDS